MEKSPDDRFKRGQKGGKASRSWLPWFSLVSRPSSLLPSLSCLPVALLFLSSYSHPPRRAVPFLSWDFLPSLSSSSSKNLTSDLTRFGPTVILHRGCLFPFFLFIVDEAVRSICGNLDDDEFYNFTMKELNHLNHLNEFI